MPAQQNCALTHINTHSHTSLRTHTSTDTHVRAHTQKHAHTQTNTHTDRNYSDLTYIESISTDNPAKTFDPHSYERRCT